MKTIKYKKQDGFKIITGSGMLADDPVASREVADNELLRIINENYTDLPELGTQIEKIKEKGQHWEVATQKKQQAGVLHIAKQAATIAKDFVGAKRMEQEQKKLETEMKGAQNAADFCDCELKEIKQVVNPKIMDIRRNNLVYCEPGADQMVDESTANQVASKSTADMVRDGAVLPDGKTASELLQLFLGKQGDEQICIDGSSVADNIGTWYKKTGATWEEKKIDKLDVKPGGGFIKKEDLTPEQLEEIRIQNLTPEQLETEKLAAIDAAAMQAAAMRSKLEIQGDKKALATAKAWYDSEVVKIESRLV